jgi:hypothetical protein
VDIAVPKQKAPDKLPGLKFDEDRVISGGFTLPAPAKHTQHAEARGEEWERTGKWSRL